MDHEKIDSLAESFLKVFPVVIRYFILLGDKLSDPEYSYQEYQALHILKEFESLPISAVGTKLLISKPRMTVMVDKLIAADFIERTPDKRDRRIINISLTDKGREFISIHRQNLKESIIKRFHNLSDDEADKFVAAMIMMQDMMKKTEGEEEY